MQNAVRTRIRALPGVPSTTTHGRARVPSLVDTEALAVLHRSARVLLDDLPQLTDQLVAALREHEPAYRAAIESDPADVWQEAHRSLRFSVGSLIDPRRTRDAARNCSRQIGADRAEQGMPLDALLHAFRLGGGMVWKNLVEVTAESRPEDVRLLVHVAADVWSFVDEHCSLVAESYRQVERRLTWRRENRLRVMAAALLDGTSRIADLPEVSAALDLPEQGRYAVVAVDGGRGAPRTGPRPACGRTGGRVLWHAGEDMEYGIVLIGEGSLGELAATMTGPPGARIGVSSVVEGLAAVGDARRLAETALRACPRSGGTVLLEEHLPTALVVSAPALGSALADRVLGPLLRLDPSDRDLLLDTLSVWLDCDGSAQRASARLYCHRNTVLNRLRRCEQLTGRSLTRPADVVEFSLALTARRLLPA
ncbi:CdaR family transcriptional regulator [Streptomyces sp. GC420]|uniref:PucR family transcriptional regulator n=1 Tax=Streptomyces sp. GC420 TaxID=2697568 RepID=UPI001414E40F|nr:PucR family transcriptional regulator [Streptomyces sp. GC420]NBM14710.1 PucR family transcriptional regulator [Streptomyces sp. GC420]